METNTSLANLDTDLFSPFIKKLILEIPREYTLKSEGHLKAKLKPTLTQYQLKEQFHAELARARERGKKMVMTKVFGNVYKKDYFYDIVLRDHLLMAWVTAPIAGFDLKISAALAMGVERYEEVINMSFTTNRRIKQEKAEWEMIDEIDPTKVSVWLSCMKGLEDRKMGVAVQKQVTLNVTEPTVDANSKSELNMDMVNDRLKELEEKLGEASISVLPDKDD